MFTVATVTELLGWSLVINIAVLIYAAVMVVLFRDWVGGIHGRMFDLSKKDLDISYFNYLANYKIAIFIFNLVPYLALKIMA